MYQGPGGGFLSAVAIAHGISNYRKVSDKGFPEFADKERALLRKGRTSFGPPSFKKGGKVKKTGVYKLHKGERVLTVRATKKLAGKKRK